MTADYWQAQSPHLSGVEGGLSFPVIARLVLAIHHPISKQTTIEFLERHHDGLQERGLVMTAVGRCLKKSKNLILTNSRGGISITVDIEVVLFVYLLSQLHEASLL